MARTPSTMAPLGSKMPMFRLTCQASNTEIDSASFAGNAVLVMFICNHCPFVVHVMDEMILLANEFVARGGKVVAINANDVEKYPQDGPAAMRELVQSAGMNFPFCLDSTQGTAKSFGAACTPDFFLYDSGGALYYRGQMDDSRPGSDIPVTGQDLRVAMDAVLTGKPAPVKQRPSLGCNIKWVPGNEPDYFGA